MSYFGESGINHLFNLLFTGGGALIGYLAAVRVSDRKEFQKAAADFQESFLDVILTLDKRYNCIDRGDRSEFRIIQDSFPRQMKAMMIFRLHLPAGKQEDFDKAWADYCCYKAKQGHYAPSLAQYHGTDCQLAITRIHNLLKFSEIAHKSPFANDSG